MVFIQKINATEQLRDGRVMWAGDCGQPRERRQSGGFESRLPTMLRSTLKFKNKLMLRNRKINILIDLASRVVRLAFVGEGVYYDSTEHFLPKMGNIFKNGCVLALPAELTN